MIYFNVTVRAKYVPIDDSPAFVTNRVDPITGIYPDTGNGDVLLKSQAIDCLKSRATYYDLIPKKVRRVAIKHVESNYMNHLHNISQLVNEAIDRAKQSCHLNLNLNLNLNLKQ